MRTRDRNGGVGSSGSVPGAAAFAAAGLAQVPYVCVQSADLREGVTRERTLQRIEALGYPCFVKPANLGSSVGISKVRNRYIGCILKPAQNAAI